MRKFRNKQYARQRLLMARKSGKIIKQNECEICKNKGNIQGHHPNYRFALKVIWVCRDCHCKIHKLR